MKTKIIRARKSILWLEEPSGEKNNRNKKRKKTRIKTKKSLVNIAKFYSFEDNKTENGTKACKKRIESMEIWQTSMMVLTTNWGNRKYCAIGRTKETHFFQINMDRIPLSHDKA